MTKIITNFIKLNDNAGKLNKKTHNQPLIMYQVIMLVKNN